MAAADFKATVVNVGATASERNIVWYSTSSAAQSVSVAPADGSAAAIVVAASTTGASNDAGWTFNQATVTGLAPNTTYAYRVGSEADGWSTLEEFTTGGTSDFDALLFGDPQMGSGGGIPTDAEAWAANFALAAAQYPGADFVMTMGDQVNTAGDENEYAQFLSPEALDNVTLATNIGNHDNGSTSYGQHFFLPNTDPVAGAVANRPGLGNYHFVYNGVLFLSFNSNNRTDADHFAWAERVVAEHPEATWRIATFHHGPYSTASHADHHRAPRHVAAGAVEAQHRRGLRWSRPHLLPHPPAGQRPRGRRPERPQHPGEVPRRGAVVHAQLRLGLEVLQRDADDVPLQRRLPPGLQAELHPPVRDRGRPARRHPRQRRHAVRRRHPDPRPGRCDPEPGSPGRAGRRLLGRRLHPVPG